MMCQPKQALLRDAYSHRLRSGARTSSSAMMPGGATQDRVTTDPLIQDRYVGQAALSEQVCDREITQ